MNPRLLDTDESASFTRLARPVGRPRPQGGAHPAGRARSRGDGGDSLGRDAQRQRHLDRLGDDQVPGHVHAARGKGPYHLLCRAAPCKKLPANRSRSRWRLPTS